MPDLSFKIKIPFLLSYSYSRSTTVTSNTQTFGGAVNVRPTTPPGQAPSISRLRREAEACLRACRTPSNLDLAIGEWADLEDGFEPAPLQRRHRSQFYDGEGTEGEENGKKNKKKSAFVKFAKRITRFLFHFDGGRTDSRGRLLLRDLNRSPDPRNMRRRTRGTTFSGERPVFRDVDWNPSPQPGNGEVRGEEQGEGSGSRQCCAVGTGTAYEGCCEGPSRPKLVTSEAEVAASVNRGEEDNEENRGQTDSGVGGLVYQSSSEDGHDYARGDQCSCGILSGDDGNDEMPADEVGYGELSAHPSPFTRVEDDGRYGYF
ncbi:hypothetical protein G7Y79_00060g092100 [Physcia stellaris]|nr:hypothetical protein G7Y79_00060g092100 [Physcia stellaris]